jgi:hypothetical protein
MGMASAMDMTMYGLYADTTYDWHRTNCAMATDGNTLEKRWRCIEGIILTRPELLQVIIKKKLEGIKKELYLMYPITEKEKNDKVKKQQATRKRRLPWAHSYVITDDQSMFDHIDAEQEGMDGQENAVPRQRARRYKCNNLSCEYDRNNGKPNTGYQVTSKNAKCEKCRAFHNSIDLATEIEETLRTNPASRHKLNKKLAEVDKASRLKTIQEWARNEDKIQGNQKQATDETVNRAARRVATTLTIDVRGSRIAGADATPDEANRNETIQQSADTCQQGTCQEDNDDSDENNDEICHACGHLQQGNTT